MSVWLACSSSAELSWDNLHRWSHCCHGETGRQCQRAEEEGREITNGPGTLGLFPATPNRTPTPSHWFSPSWESNVSSLAPTGCQGNEKVSPPPRDVIVMLM